MMVEGINLLRGMVKVFRVTSKVRTYFLFAWGRHIFGVLDLSFNPDYLELSKSF